MSAPAVTVGPGINVGRVARTMRELGLTWLAVVDSDDRVVGAGRVALAGGASDGHPAVGHRLIHAAGARGSGTPRALSTIRFVHTVIWFSIEACPLTAVAESFGARSGSVTDVYLPSWFAHRLPAIHVTLVLPAHLLHFRNLRHRRATSEPVDTARPWRREV
ncbi:CBS domain-containing protein [Pseudonocardia sp. GCM10023141]|uniref:CBS domain-containing protein n=1 Tax=Pseudonocardia sp. GCM10023141 TaxID=3252653 RepID=UPI0036220607